LFHVFTLLGIIFYMITEQIRTAEFVTPKHPDKICDFIVDSILDAYLAQDPKSRVAAEAMGGHGLITVTGEVTSNAQVDVEKIIRAIVGENYEIKVKISQQSQFIAQGVDKGGAGDQGIMTGYACTETPNFMPYEYELARWLCQKIYEKYPFDGKTQTTVEGSRIISVVASFQNSQNAELEALVRSLVPAENYFINEAGEWTVGGFDADSGLSGRKIVIDNYGPNVSVGGGSFSGKDATKVDRSGAYMARKIAIDYLKKRAAKEVFVKLAYVIGKPEPVMAVAQIDNQEIKIEGYDLTPRGISTTLGLDKPIFSKTTTWGHFGRNQVWDS